MLSNYLSKRTRMNVSRLLLLLVGIAFVLPAFAASNTVQTLSAQDMINRIVEQIPSLMRMVTAIAYVMGMYFIFFSMMKFKRYGEMRTMMSMQHHLREPMTYLIVGALLIYLPSSVQVGMTTFWAEPNPYGYLQEEDQWSQFIANCFLIVQLFGTIAFIRGLTIIGQLGGRGGGQGALGKGVTHIIGGVFCINIYQFVQVILFTLGIQSS